MNNLSLQTDFSNDKLTLRFQGEFTLYQINKYQIEIDTINFSEVKQIIIDLSKLTFIDILNSLLPILLQVLHDELLGYLQ